MTARKNSNRQARKVARRKMMKGLASPVRGTYKMAKMRKK